MRGVSLNWFTATIMVCVTALITYGFCAYCHGVDTWALALGTAVTSLVALTPTALRLPSWRQRTKTNLCAMASAYFMLALAVDIIFATLVPEVPAYLIVCGLTALIYLKFVSAVLHRGVN